MEIYSYTFLISAVMIFLTLIFASYSDLKYRRFAHKNWYPLLCMGLPISIVGYYELFLDGRYWFVGLILMTAGICVLAYAMGLLGLCGGADTWAIIFIAVFLPVYPVQPIFGIPAHNSFALSVLTIAILFNLSIPLYLFIINSCDKDKVPFWYRFIVHKVTIQKISVSHGYVIEGDSEISDSTPHFLPISYVLRGGQSGGLIDVRDMVDRAGNTPEQYLRYLSKGYVWVSYASPFLVFITIGFIVSILFGDVSKII